MTRIERVDRSLQTDARPQIACRVGESLSTGRFRRTRERSPHALILGIASDAEARVLDDGAASGASDRRY